MIMAQGHRTSARGREGACVRSWFFSSVAFVVPIRRLLVLGPFLTYRFHYRRHPAWEIPGRPLSLPTATLTPDRGPPGVLLRGERAFFTLQNGSCLEWRCAH